MLSVWMTTATTSPWRPSEPWLTGRAAWATLWEALAYSENEMEAVPLGVFGAGNIAHWLSGLCSACQSAKPGRRLRDPSRGGNRGAVAIGWVGKNGDVEETSASDLKVFYEIFILIASLVDTAERLVQNAWTRGEMRVD